MSALDLEVRKIALHGVTGSYITFTEPFIKFPYVTITVSGSVSQGSANINTNVRNISTVGFDLEFSETFTGYVHYKAARSE
ncbi:hypothetical protein OAA09_00245 [bacterium]|nr:hypothetical protein [bacterium]